METIKEAGNMALNAATKMEIPSNETLVSGIDKAKKALRTTVLESDVSGGKKKVAKEVESILESIETFLNENNDGDALQSFFSDSKKVVEELTSEVKDDAEKTKKLKGDLKEIFGASKDLSLALLKDKDLRELMMNSAQLLQRFIVSITRSKGIDVPEEILDKLGMSESAGSGKKRKTSKKGSKSAPKKVTEKEMKELGSEILKTLQSFKEKEEYQKALDSFFTLFRHISDRVESIKENPELSLDKNSSLKKMLEDGQKVMEGFTGSKSLTSLFESLSGIFSLDSKDLKEYFSSWKDYLAEIKENPELLTGKDAAKKIGELIHKAKDLFQEDSIRDAFNNFFGEFGDFLSNIQPGNMGSKLASGASELIGHLVGKGGKITISSLSQALPQVKSLVMPLLLSQLDKLPFPKLEGKSDNWTWAVEGIQFAASDIMTDRIKMDFHTSTDVKLKDLSNELSTAELSLTIKGIKSSIKDIKFEYKRDGLVPIQDAGLADVTFGGEGADLEVKWYLESQGSNTPQITEAEVSCKIDKLDVFVKQAHHEFLDSIVTSLFSGFLKHEFEKQIESGLIKMVVKSSVELNKVLNHFAEKEESTPAAK